MVARAAVDFSVLKAKVNYDSNNVYILYYKGKKREVLL
jgi:hypothetical protein